MECFECLNACDACQAYPIFSDDERQFESYDVNAHWDRRRYTEESMGTFATSCPSFSLRHLPNRKTLSLSKHLCFRFRGVETLPSRCESQSTTMESYSAEEWNPNSTQHLSAKLCQVKCNFYAHKIMYITQYFGHLLHVACGILCVAKTQSLSLLCIWSGTSIEKQTKWIMPSAQWTCCILPVLSIILFHIRVDAIEQLMKCVFFVGRIMQIGKGIKATTSNAIVKSNSLNKRFGRNERVPATCASVSVRVRGCVQLS